MRRSNIFLVILIILMTLNLAGCGNDPTPAPVASGSGASIGTATTETASGNSSFVQASATPRPTNTAQPTNAPRPTNTTAPTATPTPKAEATATPVATTTAPATMTAQPTLPPTAIAIDKPDDNCVSLLQLAERPFKENDALCVEGIVETIDRMSPTNISTLYFKGNASSSAFNNISDVLKVGITPNYLSKLQNLNFPEYKDKRVRVTGVLKKGASPIRWSMDLTELNQLKAVLLEVDAQATVAALNGTPFTPSPAPVITTAPPSSAAPTATAARNQSAGSSPCLVGQYKGNRKSGIYHAPGQRDYDKTKDDVACFDTEPQAVAAGFRRAQR